MSDATAAVGNAGGTPSAPPPPERTVYAAGGVRKFTLCFIFLLLLPFYVSLPPMLFWRVTQGHWTGTFGLVVLALGFTVIMFLILVELMQSLRSRVEIGPTSVRLTLPSGRGPTPILRYRSADIPYDQIAAVETRREIYGGSIAPVLLRGARLILKDGAAVKLGYVSEANSDATFPYPEIAAQIARRAGLSLNDRGAVHRSVQKKYLGMSQPLLREPESPVSDVEIVALNQAHQRWVMRLVWLLAALVVTGIALDIIFPPSSGLPPALTSLKSLIFR